METLLSFVSVSREWTLLYRLKRGSRAALQVSVSREWTLLYRQNLLEKFPL